MTVCSDSACQKIVEEKLAIEKAKSDQIKEAFNKRAEEKKLARAKKKSQGDKNHPQQVGY